MIGILDRVRFSSVSFLFAGIKINVDGLNIFNTLKT